MRSASGGALCREPNIRSHRNSSQPFSKFSVLIFDFARNSGANSPNCCRISSPHSEIPPDEAARAGLPPNVKTLADGAIQATEDVINSYLTVKPLVSKAPTTTTNVRVAIRLLREALKPFIQGAVDSETADIVPADLDAKLAFRDEQLAKLRSPPERQRILVYSRQLIVQAIRGGASKIGEMVGEQEILRYVDTALNFARIKHPCFAKHRKRLAALVFPKD
jgi:hypothetical protein